MEKNDALLIFTLAYALDWLIGDPEWAPHPVRWMGRLIQGAEHSLRTFIRIAGWETITYGWPSDLEKTIYAWFP